MTKRIYTVKRVSGLVKPLLSHSGSDCVSLSTCIACIQDVWHKDGARTKKKKKKKKTWKMPYFCFVADSSIVWAFSWGTETVSETSSDYVLHKGGGGRFCSIISWNSVITLIVWSATQTPCVTVQLQSWHTHTHTPTHTKEVTAYSWRCENKTWMHANEGYICGNKCICVS